MLNAKRLIIRGEVTFEHLLVSFLTPGIHLGVEETISGR